MRRFFLCFSAILPLIACAPEQTPQTAQVVQAIVSGLPSDGSPIKDIKDIENVEDYKSLTAAVTAIGSRQTDLLINSATTLVSNTTVTDNIRLVVKRAGSISQGPFNLTITGSWKHAGTVTGSGSLRASGPVHMVGGTIANSGNIAVSGPFESGLYHVFTGTGTVSFGVGSTTSVFPQWWGAYADNSHPTETTAAIQRAMTSIYVCGGIVSLPAGIYKTNAVLYAPSNITLLGSGMRPILGTTIHGAHTGAAVVSLKGSIMVSIRHLCIQGDAAAIPQTGLCLGRSFGQSAGRHYIEEVNVHGSFSKAAVYSIASEENIFVCLHANVLGGTAKYTFYTSEADDLHVDAMAKSTNFACSVYTPELLHQGTVADSAAIYINVGANTLGWLFKGGFTGMTSGRNSSHIWLNVDVDPSVSHVGGFTFEDVGCEAWSNAAPPIQVFRISGVKSTLAGLRIVNCQIGQYLAGTQYYLYGDDDITLKGADIVVTGTSHPSSIWALRDSRVNTPDQSLAVRRSVVRNNLNALNVIRPAISSNNLITSTTYGPITYVGAGRNTFTISAATQFTGTVSRAFRVQIDRCSAPNTFKWSKDGGATWDATGVAITGSDQTLTEGVAIKIETGTGHILGDKWEFVVDPYLLMK